MTGVQTCALPILIIKLVQRKKAIDTKEDFNRKSKTMRNIREPTEERKNNGRVIIALPYQPKPNLIITTMNESSLKLKTEVVRQLTKNEQIMDEKYLYKGGKVYSRRELAAEIESESELGIDILGGMILLAIDITTRQK